MCEYNLSIIIPVFNTNPKLLERCINSIYHNYKFDKNDIEIILINDCSTNVDTIEWLKANKNRFALFENKENLGASYSRDSGIKKCRGKYITFVDSDDYILDDYFDVINEVIKSDKDFYILKEKKIHWETYCLILKKDFIKFNNINYFLDCKNDYNQVFRNHGEDLSFFLKVILKSNNYEIFNIAKKRYYFYDKRASINSKKIRNKNERLYYGLLIIYYTIKEIGTNDVQKINSSLEFIFKKNRELVLHPKKIFNGNNELKNYYMQNNLYLPHHGIFHYLTIVKLYRFIFHFINK